MLVRVHHSLEELSRKDWTVFSAGINREIFQVQKLH